MRRRTEPPSVAAARLVHLGRCRSLVEYLPDNGVMVEIDPERFEAMVAEALDGLPADLAGLLSNVP